MSTGAHKTTMTIGNAIIDTHAQLLQHIGAIHDNLSTRDRHLHRVEMFQELQYLHANAIEEQNTQSKKTATPQFHIGNGNDNNQHPSQPETIRQSMPEPGGHHHNNPPAFGKLALRRWHAEEAHEQPWNARPHGEGAAAHEGRTILDRPKI